MKERINRLDRYRIKIIECRHIKEAPSFYIHKLIGANLCLCKHCEKKLREEIFAQIKVEKEVDELAKKHKWMKPKGRIKNENNIRLEKR